MDLKDIIAQAVGLQPELRRLLIAIVENAGSGGPVTVTWGDITGKPSTFAPATHTHTAAQISDASTVGRQVLTGADAAAIRSTLAIPAAPSNGTAAQLEAGTDTTGRLFSAKMIHDEIARQIAAITP